MYSRFKALPGYGEEELGDLENSTVAVVGLGATGSVIAEHLARHGVNLILVDRDYLEMNDCYSSSLYTPEQCEKAVPKAEAAEEKLSDFTEVKSYACSLKAGNTGMLEEADLVMDGTDNMETRFLIDEYCRKNDKPWIYTAALGEKGYSMFFRKKCFSCVFEKVAPGDLDTCETAGVMREVSTAMASVSSRKAVRYLAGKEVNEKLEKFSGESFEVSSEGCETCEEEEFPHLESSDDTVAVCGENKFQLKREIGEEAMERLKRQADDFRENKYLVKADLDGRDFTLFRSGRAIIEAEDRGHAEAIFSEIVGV